MPEPTTEAGRDFAQEVADTAGDIGLPEAQECVALIEQEAAAMGAIAMAQHIGCFNEWACQLTLHDWTAHLGRGFDHD